MRQLWLWLWCEDGDGNLLRVERNLKELTTLLFAEILHLVVASQGTHGCKHVELALKSLHPLLCSTRTLSTLTGAAVLKALAALPLAPAPALW